MNRRLTFVLAVIFISLGVFAALVCQPTITRPTMPIPEAVPEPPTTHTGQDYLFAAREVVVFDQKPTFNVPDSWGQPEFYETSLNDERDFGAQAKPQVAIAFKRFGNSSITIIVTESGQSLYVEGHYVFRYKTDVNVNDVSTLMSELMSRYGVRVSAYFIDKNVISINLNNDGELTSITNDRG